MWVRKIGKKGMSNAIVLPEPAMKLLGWQVGDFVTVRFWSKDEIRVTKFAAHDTQSKIADALTELKDITYEPEHRGDSA